MAGRASYYSRASFTFGYPRDWRVRKSQVCPAPGFRFVDPRYPLAIQISYCRALRFAESAACIAARKVSLMRVW